MPDRPLCRRTRWFASLIESAWQTCLPLSPSTSRMVTTDLCIAGRSRIDLRIEATSSVSLEALAEVSGPCAAGEVHAPDGLTCSASKAGSMSATGTVRCSRSPIERARFTQIWNSHVRNARWTLIAAPGSPFPAQSLGPIGSEFRPTNPSQLYVSNAHAGAGNGTVSAFHVSRNGVLSSIGDSPVPNGQTAPCWVEISHDGRQDLVRNRRERARRQRLRRSRRRPHGASQLAYAPSCGNIADGDRGSLGGDMVVLPRVV